MAPAPGEWGRCWARSTDSPDPAGTEVCRHQAASDLGLCAEHLEKLRDQEEPPDAQARG